MKPALAKAFVTLLCVSLVAGPMPARASQTINCSSSGYRYQYCRVDTENEVRLERQHSSSRCDQGYSWGYDRHGVWVDHGCGADFRVGRESGGRNNRALAAGAAIAGVAIIAALASQNKGHQSSDVPSWAVGTFSGYDDVEQVDVQLTILPGGKVSGVAGGARFEGRFTESRFETERQVFRIERAGNGFVATDERNARHRVVYRRSGGGY